MNTQELLDNFNIAHVLYVDDSTIVNADDYKEKYQQYVLTNVGNTGWPFNFIEPEIGSVIISMLSWWQNATEEDKLQELNRCAICNTEDINQQLSQDIPADKLVYCSPDKFNEELENLSNGDNSARVLILMDKDLGNGHDGMNLLQECKNNDQLCCGLFSNQIQLNKEVQVWAEMEYDPRIFPLSKQRLERSELFTEGIRNVLCMVGFKAIKDDFNNIIDNAVDKVKKEIKEIDPVSMDHAVIRRAAKEGCWEFEILRQMSDALLNYYVGESLSNENFEDFQKHTSLLKQSTLLKKQHFNNQVLSSIRKKELFDTGTHINHTYSPIANGDVFEINESEYILLLQPCNISIRKTGDRKCDIGYLVPLREETKKIMKIDNENEAIEIIDFPELRHEMHEGENKNTSMYAILNEYFTINLNVLDLCAYNKDGKAVIDVNKDKNSLENTGIMQENLLTHYESVRGKFKEIYDMYAKVQESNMEEDKKAFLCNKILTHNEFALNVPMQVNESTIFYDIKRVKRYNEHIAAGALITLTNYMSRPANTVNYSEK